jgi:hypothetical protein
MDASKLRTIIKKIRAFDKAYMLEQEAKKIVVLPIFHVPPKRTVVQHIIKGGIAKPRSPQHNKTLYI